MKKEGETLLPCFVAVGEDFDTFELEGYTVREVAQCHQLLVPRGEEIVDRFPAGIELIIPGAISEVLVGRRSWASPLAQWEAELLLKDPDRAKVLYDKWKIQARAQVLETFQILKLTERRLYGANSFFLWQEEHPGETIPHRGTDPDPEWDNNAYSTYCD